MSFKPEVQADSSGTWSSNACRFATETEAKQYVASLSDASGNCGPVNYTLVGGQLKALLS